MTPGEPITCFAVTMPVSSVQHSVCMQNFNTQFIYTHVRENLAVEGSNWLVMFCSFSCLPCITVYAQPHTISNNCTMSTLATEFVLVLDRQSCSRQPKLSISNGPAVWSLSNSSESDLPGNLVVVCLRAQAARAACRFEPVVQASPSRIPDGFIYLRATPDICMNRLKRRQRTEEGGVTLDYLQGLHQKHEDWLSYGQGHIGRPNLAANLPDDAFKVQCLRGILGASNSHLSLAGVPEPKAIQGKVTPVLAHDSSEGSTAHLEACHSFSHYTPSWIACC